MSEGTLMLKLRLLLLLLFFVTFNVNFLIYIMLYSHVNEFPVVHVLHLIIRLNNILYVVKVVFNTISFYFYFILVST